MNDIAGLTEPLPSSTRSARAYAATHSPLGEHFGSRYVRLSESELASAAELISSMSDRLWAIVPMAEEELETAPIVFEAARWLRSLLPRERVLFLDGGSSPQNVEAARRGGAVVLRQDAIFDALDWMRLLPLLSSSQRPSGRSGQGFNVLAGHIALTALGIRDTDLVFQCDADVADYSSLAPLEHLTAAWAREEGARHAKLAKFGRNNEISMAARALQHLWMGLDLPWVPPPVKELGDRLFRALAPDKWMTCGLFMITGSIVRARPFASGYLDATLQALWTVDSPECGWRNVRHVEARAPCRDAVNTSTKHALMFTQIAMFVQSVVMFGKAPHLWTMEDIATLNRRIMPVLREVPVIGDVDGPVALYRIRAESILPSVDTLIDSGILSVARARQILVQELDRSP